MIQRIQTVYLMLVVILGILLFFLPAAEFTTLPDATQQRVFEMGFAGLEESTPDEIYTGLETPHLRGYWVYSLTICLIPLLALVDIFLYRKRLLQARFNILAVVLNLGFYAILANYIWFAVKNLQVEWHITFFACIPLICMVLTLMATRRILKDEAMVRAADRIRK